MMMMNNLFYQSKLNGNWEQKWERKKTFENYSTSALILLIVKVDSIEDRSRSCLK